MEFDSPSFPDPRYIWKFSRETRRERYTRTLFQDCRLRGGAGAAPGPGLLQAHHRVREEDGRVETRAASVTLESRASCRARVRVQLARAKTQVVPKFLSNARARAASCARRRVRTARTSSSSWCWTASTAAIRSHRPASNDLRCIRIESRWFSRERVLGRLTSRLRTLVSRVFWNSSVDLSFRSLERSLRISNWRLETSRNFSVSKTTLRIARARTQVPAVGLPGDDSLRQVHLLALHRAQRDARHREAGLRLRAPASAHHPRRASAAVFDKTHTQDPPASSSSSSSSSSKTQRHTLSLSLS